MTFTNKTLGAAHAASDMPVRTHLSQLRTMLAREEVQQFLRFLVVGATNFAINMIAYNVLYHSVHLPLVAALTLAFLISGVNGFLWSKYWTFKNQGSPRAAATMQYVKFMIVAVIGYVLNTSITVSLIAAYFTTRTGDAHFWQLLADAFHGNKAPAPFLVANGALVCASAVVVIWNFLANRYWTFRK